MDFLTMFCFLRVFRRNPSRVALLLGSVIIASESHGIKITLKYSKIMCKAY